MDSVWGCHLGLGARSSPSLRTEQDEAVEIVVSGILAREMERAPDRSCDLSH